MSILETRQVVKPWGVTTPPAPFRSAPDGRVGEVWFEPPAELGALLAKYIFTSEKLSVQVHPSDHQTERAGLGRQGKEECWLVLATEPGARLGIGFNRDVSAQEMRAAAQDGSIMSLITWHEVVPGDFFYIPANTVHAIGEGISLLEVQQNSDITYRIYDYGRPRELHLDEGLAVSMGTRYAKDRWHRHVGSHDSLLLVEGPYFTLAQSVGPVNPAISRHFYGPLLVLPRDGNVEVRGDTVHPGQCALAHSLAELAIPGGSCVLLATAP